MKTQRSKVEQLESVNLMNGSSVVVRVKDICWIESEGAFYGITDDGDAYLFWDVSVEGKARSYRRLP